MLNFQNNAFSKYLCYLLASFVSQNPLFIWVKWYDVSQQPKKLRSSNWHHLRLKILKDEQ